MRYVLLAMIVGVSLNGQAIMDASAAAAGGVAGGAAGKKVNDGMNSVLGKVAKQAAQAAGEKPTAEKAKPIVAVQSSKAAIAPAPAESAPLLEVSPGMPKSSGGVPLPPDPPHRVAAARPAPPPPPAPEPVVAAPPPPPPPEVTSDDLKKVAAGMNRDELLKMGVPGSRITMFDDGHLQETYRYYAHGPNGEMPIGVVRLVDGSVATVRVN